MDNIGGYLLFAAIAAITYAGLLFFRGDNVYISENSLRNKSKKSMMITRWIALLSLVAIVLITAPQFLFSPGDEKTQAFASVLPVITAAAALSLGDSLVNW